MPADLPTLQLRLDSLKAALASSRLSVSYGDKHVTFRSIADIREAIADVEGDIAALSGTSVTRTFNFTTRKGL